MGSDQRTIEIAEFSPQAQYLEISPDLQYEIKGTKASEKDYLQRWLSKDINELMKLPRTRKEAKSKGITKYFTGKACPQGHVTTRMTASNHCDACRYLAGRKVAQKKNEATKEKTRERNLRLENVVLEDNFCETSPPLLSQERAIEKKQRFYYTGRACIRGHFSQRYTRGNSCVQCQKEDNRRRFRVSIIKLPEQMTIAKNEV